MHTCHAEGCGKAVPPKMLMCLHHWRMVDVRIQREVWSLYHPGQERDKSPSRAYLVVHHLAVAWVADLEGRAKARDRHVDSAVQHLARLEVVECSP